MWERTKHRAHGKEREIMLLLESWVVMTPNLSKWIYSEVHITPRCSSAFLYLQHSSWMRAFICEQVLKEQNVNHWVYSPSLLPSNTYCKWPHTTNFWSSAKLTYILTSRLVQYVQKPGGKLLLWLSMNCKEPAWNISCDLALQKQPSSEL